MVSEPTIREEIESMQRICELIVEEKDPVQLHILWRELDSLLEKEVQNRRKRIGQLHAPK